MSTPGENGWDFNCPQFVDFMTSNVIAKDDEADQWFDYDHENGVPVNSDEQKSEPDIFSTPETEVKHATRSSKTGKTPASAARTQLNDVTNTETATPTLESIKRVTRSNTPRGTNQEQEINTELTATPDLESIRKTRSKTPKKTEQVKTEPQIKAPGISNVCTNLAEWRKNTAGAPVINASHGKIEVTSTTTAAHKPAEKRQHRSLERTNSVNKKQRYNVPGQGTTSNEQKKQASVKRSASCSVRNRGAGSTEHKEHNDPQRILRSRGTPDTSQIEKSVTKLIATKTHMTIPTTPTLMKRKPMKTNASVKNSEDLELEKIEFYRQELAKKRKMAQDSLKTALTSKGPTVVANKIELTKPQAFQFETDNRIKAPAADTKVEETRDFTKILRANRAISPAPSGPKRPVRTVPQPFKLTEMKKRRPGDLEEKQAEKYESMAQKLAAFQATPERFRSKRKVNQNNTSQERGRSRSPPGMTIPRTPNFETRSRSRPVNAPTREELEEKEIEEMKKNQFKARPMNQRIFTQDQVGVKEVQRKAATVPEEFHLSTDNRSNHPRIHNETEKESYEFHAQPLNKKIMDGVVGVHQVKPQPVTIPESPAMALKNRVRIPVEVSQQEEKRSRRSRPVPHFGIPFQPQLEHRITEAEPFTFEERDKGRQRHKEQVIQQKLDEEHKARDFRATPLPDLDNSHLPDKKKMPLTVIEPFNLESDNRGAKKAEEWKHKIEEELRQQKEQMKFRARSPTVLDQEPFQPHKPHKHTDDISAFEFSTAKRAFERDVFEMHKKKKQEEIDSIRRQEQKMKDDEERVELERLRQESQHKAKPIRKYKPVVLHGSEKPLTAPMSPHFKTDSRLNTRRSHHTSNLSVNV